MSTRRLEFGFGIYVSGAFYKTGAKPEYRETYMRSRTDEP